MFRDVVAIEEGREGMGRTRMDGEGSRLLHVEVELALSSQCGPGLATAERRRALLYWVSSLPTVTMSTATARAKALGRGVAALLQRGSD